MTADILSLSVRQVLDSYAKKELSPVEVASATHAQTVRLNPALNAYCRIAEEKDFLNAARQSESRWIKGAAQGPLDGIPVSIKDWYDVIGWPTRYGSLTSPTDAKTADSPVVNNLRASGALFLGKTTLPEMGHKGSTHGPLYGVTRNPWDLSKTPGGSSGGDGAAAAARMGFLHLGSDAGGSVRIPASFCGIFAIKPTTGTIPAWPPSPFSGLSSAGPMARSVEDAALMLETLSQSFAPDWNAAAVRDRDFTANLNDAPRGLKIAYVPTINDCWVDPEIAAHVAAAAQKMSAFGEVTEIKLDLPTLLDTFYKHWMSIASWMAAKLPADKRAQLDPYLASWVTRGDKLTRDDYISAELERMMIGHVFKKIFAEYDLLIMPTTPVAAFAADEDMARDRNGQPWEDWTPFTLPANLGKFPAASLPCGLTSAGLPCGVQIMSDYLKDHLVLRTAQALEQAIGFKDWVARGLHKDIPHKKSGAAA